MPMAMDATPTQGRSQEFQKGFPIIEWISSWGLTAPDADKLYMHTHFTKWLSMLEPSPLLNIRSIYIFAIMIYTK